MKATIHNAKKVTRDGRDHYVTSITGGPSGIMWASTSGFDTLHEAEAFLTQFIRERGFKLEIEIEISA